MRFNRDLKSFIFQKLGRSYLPFDGFHRVVKDTEIMFNNRPLQYVEDQLGPRVLTPNSIIYGREAHRLEENEIEKTVSKLKRD